MKERTYRDHDLIVNRAHTGPEGHFRTPSDLLLSVPK